MPDQNNSTNPPTTPSPFDAFPSDVPSTPASPLGAASDQPPAAPPAGGAGPTFDIPTIVSPPAKKGVSGRVIATILGILVLVGGLGAGIILVQQQQLFRQKANEQVACKYCSGSTEVGLVCLDSGYPPACEPNLNKCEVDADCTTGGGGETCGTGQTCRMGGCLSDETTAGECTTPQGPAGVCCSPSEPRPVPGEGSGTCVEYFLYKCPNMTQTGSGCQENQQRGFTSQPAFQSPYCGVQQIDCLAETTPGACAGGVYGPGCSQREIANTGPINCGGGGGGDETPECPADCTFACEKNDPDKECIPNSGCTDTGGWACRDKGCTECQTGDGGGGDDGWTPPNCTINPKVQVSSDNGLNWTDISGTTVKVPAGTTKIKIRGINAKTGKVDGHVTARVVWDTNDKKKGAVCINSECDLALPGPGGFPTRIEAFENEIGGSDPNCTDYNCQSQSYYGDNCVNRGGVNLATGAPAQCLNIKAFDTEWVEITDLSTLKAGDKVRFTVAGQTSTGSFDRARFIINGVTRPEVTAKRPNTQEFYDEYTIPTGITTFSVNAQLHHTTLGWF